MADHLRQPKSLVSTLFSVGIIAGAVWVLSPFLLSLLWAAIIAIAFWPLHNWVLGKVSGRPNSASLLTTLLVAVLLVGPMIALLLFAVNDVLNFTDFLLVADGVGVHAPVWLKEVPVLGRFLEDQWQFYIATPDQLSVALKESLTSSLSVVQTTAQTLLVELLERVATLFFALWVLFFFFRDGVRLSGTLNRIGNDWLGRRWHPYVIHLPSAMRASVNGLVIVSFAEAVLLASLYFMCGVPGAVLFGTFTAVIAFVPMAAPAVLAVVAMVLFTAGNSGASIALFVVGTIVVLFADYLIRPMLIQDGTHLPFLAVLFGVFGGVIMLGIVGLIIGPVMLVLLVVFFDEASHIEEIVPRREEDTC
jgi:predicted PurR-regulated permease PerM